MTSQHWDGERRTGQSSRCSVYLKDGSCQGHHGEPEEGDGLETPAQGQVEGQEEMEAVHLVKVPNACQTQS